jgi:hypothetical protein
MKRIGFLGIAILIALTATLAGAQTNYVALRGVARDPQGLGIPAASVKLTDERTGRERDTTADAHGAYEFGGLLPGSYVLEAVSTGFGVSKRQILLEVGEQATLDVILQVGPAKEIVTAETATELLKTADASVGEVVDQRSVSQLPLNGRMLVDLMLTVPGAHVSHGGADWGHESFVLATGATVGHQRGWQSAECELFPAGWRDEYRPDL